MATKPPVIVISDLKGGLNNTDDPIAIGDNQCTVADNVEFFQSSLGERRKGCESIDLTGSTLDAEHAIVFLGTFHPEFTELPNNELWAIGATFGSSVTIARRSGTAWSVVTPVDPILTDSATVTKIKDQSIHGKYFLAYRSGVSRLHVYDGTTLRRSGLAPPTAAPTAADDAGAGSFTDDRTYRVRFTVQSSGTTLLRSEPSDELVHTPAGTKAGVTVTRPAVVDGNETHWELEASYGDGNFYVIATTAIGTTTYDDTNIPATAYADFTLSETIGNYTVIPSVKYIITDQDRLVFAGDWEDPNLASRVSWTPVSGATGVGNDERIPTATDNFIDLDWQDEGSITGLSRPINGSFYVFKLSRIYKFQRTGDVTDAYRAYLLSATKGALQGSIVDGVDEAGAGCVYFLDPSVGPCRIGNAGLQSMRNVNGTWRTVNTSASIPCHGVFYPDKKQVHLWIATDSALYPNLKLVCQTNEVQSVENGTIGGWSTASGLMTEAYCSTVVPEITDSTDGTTRMSFRPFIGLTTPDFIQRCDVGTTDNGTTYRGMIVTKPIVASGLVAKWGVLAAALLADAIDSHSTTMDISLIRDFGVETIKLTTDFVPVNAEETVIKRFDQLALSGVCALQIQFSDPESFAS